MAVAQASLLLDHNYAEQAEQAYQIATELCPVSPEAVFQYVGFLINRSRTGDATLVAENALKAAPNNQQFQDLTKQLSALQKH
jgi:cytochrome c-type biogenesis protein CcmH/NrfG